jgi:energy-coupling factor transporter ATP-binding protein EcfA2
MEIYTSRKFDRETIFKILIQGGKEVTPDFVLNEYDKEVYLRLFLYFFNDASFEKIHPSYKLQKGLWLVGSRGVGKTILFKVFQNLMKQYSHQERFGLFRPIEICGKYSSTGFGVIESHSSECFKKPNGGIIDKNKPIVRLYDDLGSEDKSTSHFGSKINVMEKVLMLRYDQFKINGMKTYITTNLEGEEIEKFYGPRVRSRLPEMTNAIYYPGVDRRK